MTGLLSKAADFFKGRDVSIANRYRDDRGQYAFLVWMPGAEGNRTPLIVTAKQYLVSRDDDPQDRQWASFMRTKVLQRAADADGRVVLFLPASNQYDDGRRLVFDPQAVLEHGVEPGDQSTRKKAGEDWLDIPADWGCDMVDWVERRDGPKTDGPDGHLIEDQSVDHGGQPTLGDYDG